MPLCTNCKTEMEKSEIESTAMRNVYRCFRCDTRKKRRSGLSWVILGGRLLLLAATGVPVVDPTDFVGG